MNDELYTKRVAYCVRDCYGKPGPDYWRGGLEI